jgi:ABC-type phosphate transport system auxiliary subunit
VGVAVFAWLAGGSAWAWAATGAIGVAAIAVAGVVLRRAV